MQHKRRHTIDRLQKKYKRIAAAFAGAAILAGASLPGVPATIVHASPDATSSPAPDTTVPVGDTNMAALTSKSPGSPAVDNRQKLEIIATAYAPGPHDNAQWGNKTFLGTQIRPGIIAVDPKVIPLGSRVYIEYPDGHGEYAIAEDTGGAIKGNRIDVAKWTVNEAKRFGMQKVKVTILSSPRNA